MHVEETTTIHLEIHSLLEQPCGQQLELRKRFRSPDILANLISGFAHKDGGRIIIGFDPKKKRVVGCRRHRVALLVKQAEERLGHTGLARLEFHEIEKRELAIVSVVPVDVLLHAPGGLLVREQAALRAMSKKAIMEQLQKRKERLGLEAMGSMIYSMGVAIYAAKKNIDQESTLFSKLKGHILGAVIGAGVGAALTLVCQYATTLIHR